MGIAHEGGDVAKLRVAAIRPHALTFSASVCDRHRSKDATANAAKKQQVERCQAKRQDDRTGNVKHQIARADLAAPDKNKGKQAVHDDRDRNDVVVSAGPIEELDDGSAVAFRVKSFVGLMGDMHDVLHGKRVKQK